MNKIKERSKLEWVRSHQDDDPDDDITKFSVVTKLNIKADELATQGLDKFESNPGAPMNLSLEVLLHQRGCTITRDYKVSMRSNIQLLEWKNITSNNLDGRILSMDRLNGLSSLWCTDKKRTNSFNDLETVVLEKNDTLYGYAFNE